MFSVKPVLVPIGYPWTPPSPKEPNTDTTECCMKESNILANAIIRLLDWQDWRLTTKAEARQRNMARFSC